MSGQQQCKNMPNCWHFGEKGLAPVCEKPDCPGALVLKRGKSLFRSIVDGFPYIEQDCPGHVAAKAHGKICANCGVHVDELRPVEDE